MGRIVFEHQDTQDSPASGATAVYVKTDGKVYKKNSAGTESGIADAVAPVAHAASHANGGADLIATATGSADGIMCCADKTKIDTVATNADVTSANNPKAHGPSHQNGGADAVKLDDLAAPDDNTDLNASAANHGLLPKLGGGTSNFLRADGTWAAPPGGGGDNDQVGVDSGATAGYLGAASGDGVLRAGSQLSYTDGGDFVTLDVNEANIKLDDLGAPDDNTDLNATTAKHGLLPKLGGGTSNFLRADGAWAAAGGGSSGPGVMVYGEIRTKDWAPTWAQLDAAGDMVVLNVAIISSNYVGHATVAYVNALGSPAYQETYVVTDSGTIGATAVTAGDAVLWFGLGWLRIAQAAGGYVQAGIRLQLSTTVALLSPYTDGTDDGKVMAFDGTDSTGEEANVDITLTLPAYADLTETDRYRGPITIVRRGMRSYPGQVLIDIDGGNFNDSLDVIQLRNDDDVVSVAASKLYGWQRLTKLENILQVSRAASWAHTNFQTETGIPWDTIDIEGSANIAYRDGTNTSRIQIEHSGWYEISTFAQVDSTIVGLAYTVTSRFWINGTTPWTASRIEIVNYEDENMYIAHTSYAAYLSSSSYIEMRLWNNALAGSISHARMTLRSLY